MAIRRQSEDAFMRDMDARDRQSDKREKALDRAMKKNPKANRNALEARMRAAERKGGSKAKGKTARARLAGKTRSAQAR